MPAIELTLYVAGRTPRSQRAIANLQRIVDEELTSRCEVRIIDVMEDPEAAEMHRILTTPTLLKHTPAPERRITGDLSDAAKVLLGLALDSVALEQEDAS